MKFENKDFKPTKLIAVYQNKEGYYLEEHIIRERNGSFIPGAGSPLKQKTMVALSQYYNEKEELAVTAKELLLDNILMISREPGNNVVMWYMGFGNYKLVFYNKEETILMPTLIFMTRNGSLSVFACKDKERPTDKTELFHTPLPNISGSGNVCMGSAKFTKESDSVNKIVEEYTKGFYNSSFSHEGNNPYNQAYFDQMIKKGQVPYDTLVTKETTLGEYIKELR